MPIGEEGEKGLHHGHLGEVLFPTTCSTGSAGCNGAIPVNDGPGSVERPSGGDMHGLDERRFCQQTHARGGAAEFPTVLLDRRLFAAAHKGNCYTRTVTWYGKAYPNEGIAHPSERGQHAYTCHREGPNEFSPSELDADISAAAER